MQTKKDILIKEKDAIDCYLNKASHIRYNPLEEFHKNPGLEELISPYFTPLSQELTDWMNADFEHCAKSPDNLIHKTSSGKMVRSKSEAMIDLALHLNKIPYRYECVLTIGNTRFYPDFTIRHPETGELFYWEHFGLMDDPTYYKNVFSKLNTYASIGIIPNINLITTYETAKHPLSSDVVEKLIEHFFL